MKVVITSGYFDPLHAGHVEYLEKAKKLAKRLGGKLVVIVNNDKQAILKKGYFFMPLKERIKIIKSIKYVDEVVPSIDKDSTVCKTLKKLFKIYGDCVFAKGGDKFAGNIPEAGICKKYGIKIIDGLGRKIQSSSELVKRFNRKIKNKKYSC